MLRTTAVWDSHQSIRLMYNFSQLITQEKNTDFALRNLEVLAERFYSQACDCSYKSNLTQNQISELELNFIHLTGVIQTISVRANCEKLAATFQVSLLKILRYIISKTSCGPQEYKWTCNTIKFGLETAIYCHSEHMWPEMKFCLSEVNFYLKQHILSDLPLEFRAPFLLNRCLLTIFHLLWMQCIDDIDNAEIVHLLPSLLEESMELTREQMNFASIFCYNIGLSCFRQEFYVGAIRCLKVSLSLGTHNLNCNKRLSLLANCYFNLNVLEYCGEIHHIISCADESSGNLILKLRTYLATKSDDNSITNCILKYLRIQIDSNCSEMREKICQVFHMLEKKEQHTVIVQLLNRIPWREESNRFKWICAEIAARTCIHYRYLKGCYQWLTEIASWQSPEPVDRKSLENILFLIENEAIYYFNQQKLLKAVRWYEVLIKIGLRHGGLQTGMIRNAIHCSLAMGTVEGLELAKSLLNPKFQMETNLQLLHFQLLITIRDQDHMKATEAWLRLNSLYKEGNATSHWKEGKEILEECIFWAMKNQMNEILIHCLNLLIHEFKNHSNQFSVISDVVKIHLNVLLNNTAGNSCLETKCIQHLLTALISAYNMCYQETSEGHEWDSGGLELWFGDWAWNLARRFPHLLPFYRHQLFKLSYKMFRLTLDQDEGIRSKIEAAIVLSLAAGINSESQDDPPYKQILNGCLAIVEDYVDMFSENIKLVCFYQFYILCQLGDIKTVIEKFEGYHKAEGEFRNDPEFFEGLSVLASSHSEPFLIQLLPSMERKVFRQESHKLRQLKFQIKLNEIAIQSLKVANAIYSKSDEETISYRMSINWKRIISIGCEHLFLLEDIETRYFNLCEEYHAFLRMNSQHLKDSDVDNFFNQLWNLTVEIETYKGLKAAARWTNLVADISNSTPKLQKLYRSLTRRIMTSSP